MVKIELAKKRFIFTVFAAAQGHDRTSGLLVALRSSLALSATINLMRNGIKLFF